MPEAFWGLSIGELTDIIEATAEARKQERKERITDIFTQAQLIAAYVMRKEKDPIPYPWDYYPTLFQEDKERYEEHKRKAEIEEHKAQMREYARRLKERHQAQAHGGD